MGSDPAAGSSPRGSDTTGATGSTGAGSTGSDIARAGSTGGTGSDTTGTAGSGSTSTDTYGAGSTGSDDKTATGAVGSTGSANYATKLSSAQKAFQKKYDELAKLSGEKFEKAYLGALLDDHKKAIRAFEKESKSGQDPELKTWASNTLPTLRHHLEMVQSVEKDLKNRGKSSM